MAELECMDTQTPLVAVRLFEEGIMSLERELDTHFKLVVACNNRVQEMRSLSFNNEQCQYLVITLKEVTESSSAILEPSPRALSGSYAPTELENHLLSFKLLLVLAIEIESFIEGCSQDAWVPIAMTLTNMSEFVLSIGLHLELCRAALCKKGEPSGGLNLDQVASISKDVNEIVKTKASMDKEDLLKKISLVLPSLHGDEKDLASYLLQRLLRVAPIPSIPAIPESKWSFSQYFTLLRRIFGKVNQGVSIGRGSSATVFKANWLEMEVAVKVFYGKDNPEFQKEVDVLARLCHPNVTSMFCCTQETRKCSIVMELMDRDLCTLIEQRLDKNHDSLPFNIWEAVDLMHQIAEGGKYLHEQGVVHRDLKSLNILVKHVKTPGVDLEHIQAKVADFNVSKIKENSTTHSQQTMNVGSNRWMAPELIQLHGIGNYVNVGMNNQSVPKHPHKCDIYSFAMVCYEILTGELPFSAYSEDEPKKMKAMILEGGRPELPAHCPSKLQDLIEKCWNREPKSRPTFDDICRELKFVKYLLLTGTSSTSKVFQDIFKEEQIENVPKHAFKDKDDRLENIYKNKDHLKNCREAIGVMGKYAEALEDFNKAHEVEPNDAFILSGRGSVQRLMGKFAEALEDLNKANELKPNDACTLKNRGEVKRVMGKFAEALEDLNKANELEPNDACTLKNRGEVKRVMGKFAEALEDLNKANELEPNDAFTLKICGEVKRVMGKFADALEDLNKANELEPNDAFTLKNCGEVKRVMGKFAEALEDLNKANELEPNDAFTLKNRGEVKRVMGKFAEALEDLNKANEREPNDAFILSGRGSLKRVMGKFAEALEDLNKASELEPNDAFILKNRGEVKRVMGKYAEALEDLNKAHELKPTDTFTLKNRGEVKRVMEKYADALEDLNKANELEPNDALTLKICGEVKRVMGKYAEALEDLNKANELEPNDAFTLRGCGDVKRLMGKHIEALEDLNKANELKPNDALTLKNLGYVKGVMGKYVEALEDLSKANELEPNDAFTLKICGYVKGVMGNYAEALEDLNKANELEPNDAFTLKGCGDVKRLMDKHIEAVEDLNKANELKPNDALTLKNLGYVKGVMGKYVEALEDLNKANELEPNDAFTLKICGDVKRMMGKHA